MDILPKEQIVAVKVDVGEMDDCINIHFLLYSFKEKEAEITTD